MYIIGFLKLKNGKESFLTAEGSLKEAFPKKPWKAVIPNI